METLGIILPDPSPTASPLLPKPVKTAASGLSKSFVQLIVTALALTAGLAWSDAIRSLFEKGGAFYTIIGGGTKGHAEIWWAAVATTVIVFSVTAFLVRVSGEDPADLQKSSGAIRIK